MPRLALTWLGVLALLLAAPPEAGAAEFVRPGIASSSPTPRVEAPFHGISPRERTSTTSAFGVHATDGAPSEPPRTPVAPALVHTRAGALRERGATAELRVLPDARAPPA